MEPETVSLAMGVLVSTLQGATKNSLHHRLTGSTHRPVTEWLLVSDGRSDTAIRYFVGDRNTNILPGIKGILRTALPNTYELQEITWHPCQIHEHLPVPFDNVTLDTHGNRRHNQTQTESRRVPLATLVETMQEADIPIVYQAVCRSYEDWSTRQHNYIEDLRTGTVTVVDELVEGISPRSREEQRAYDPPPADETRIERISNRDPGRTLCVSARALALTRSSPNYANDIARTLANVFGHIGTEFHEVRGHLRTDDELHPGTESQPGLQV